jgi:outer membrane lipoprotein-sorting protein
MAFNSRSTRFHSRSAAILLVLATLPTTGCLFRTRKVDQTLNTYNLKTATKAELVDYINKQAAQIQTMRATVDIDTSVGGARKGKITEYKEIRGYVLARKPAMLRMEGLLPIVRTRAFDMVSDGQQFSVWIPPKNRFVVGRNDVNTPNPQQPLENLRPQVIYDALLLREIDPENEVALLEGGLETLSGDKGKKYEQPTYVIDVIRGTRQESWLSRKIVFSRSTLLPDRQLIYDQSGQLVTDVTYTIYKDYDAILFPSKIEIRRPEEEYDITLNVVKLDLNKPLGENTFVLEQPPGVQVIHLDHTQNSHGGGSE